MSTREGFYPGPTIRSSDKQGMSELAQMQAAEKEAARQKQERKDIEEAVARAQDFANILSSSELLTKAMGGGYTVDVKGEQTESDALEQIAKFCSNHPEYYPSPENARVIIRALKETLDPPAKITVKNLEKLHGILTKMNRLERKPVEQPRSTQTVREPARDAQGRYVSDTPAPTPIEKMTIPDSNRLIGWDLDELKQGRKKLKQYTAFEEAYLTAEAYLTVYGIGKSRVSSGATEVRRSVPIEGTSRTVWETSFSNKR